MNVHIAADKVFSELITTYASLRPDDRDAFVTLLAKRLRRWNQQHETTKQLANLFPTE